MFNALFGRKWNTYPPRDLNVKNLSAGIVTGLFSFVSIPVIMLEAASNGNFTMAQTILWVFAIYFFSGMYGLLLPLYYRIPIVGAQSMTVIIFLATVIGSVSYHELVGAYVVSAILLIVIGYFGAFARLLNYVPKEIISAMLAGMITKYMVTFIVSIHELAVIGGGGLIAFFIFNQWIKRIPPIFGAIGTSFLLFLLTEPIHLSASTSSFMLPTVQVPEFSIFTVITVSIPIVLFILSNDVAVGIAGLEQNKFKPPINQIVATGGLFSMATAFLGAHPTNIAGMMTAICADEESGPKEKRYMGAVITGVLVTLFGIFAWKWIPYIQALPEAFISLLLGFSLIGVFGNSLHIGFSNPKLKISTAFTFIIAMSSVTIFHISAPIWALIAGTLIASFIEGNQKSLKLKTKKAG